jgi:hypothetical protein
MARARDVYNPQVIPGILHQFIRREENYGDPFLWAALKPTFSSSSNMPVIFDASQPNFDFLDILL